MSTNSTDEKSTESQDKVPTDSKDKMPTDIKHEISSNSKDDEIFTKVLRKTLTKRRGETSKDKAAPKDRAVIHTKERGVVRNVLRFCIKEAKINALLVPLTNVRKRAAAATGVSVRTITRIRKEAHDNPSPSRKKTPGKHGGKRKGTQEDNPNSKRRKIKKSDESDTTSSDEDDKYGPDSLHDSDSLSDLKPEDFVSATPSKRPAPDEYVFEKDLLVDVNFFVRCLRKANRHHDTLSCSLDDMFMQEGAVKNGILGIVFRCRVCMMTIIVWTQDPNSKATTPLQPHDTMFNIFKGSKSNVSSSPIPMDCISPKMRNLPEFRDDHTDLPLIGWPRVATTVDVAASGGLNLPLESGQPAGATVAEMTFCIDQPEESSPDTQSTPLQSTTSSAVPEENSPDTGSTPLQSTTSSAAPEESSPDTGSIPVQSSGCSTSSAAPEDSSPDTTSSAAQCKSIDTHTQSSLKPSIGHSENKGTSKLVPQTSVTSDAVIQRPLRPKIDQSSGVRASPLLPTIPQSIGVKFSSSQPGTVKSIRGITPHFNTRLMRSSGIMPSAIRPRFIQSGGMITPPLQPRIPQSSCASASPTGMVNSPRLFFVQRPLQPQSFQSKSPGTSSAAMVKTEQTIKNVQWLIPPRLVRPSGPGSTKMISEQYFLTPNFLAHRPLLPRIVQSNGLRYTAMAKPKKIIVFSNGFTQRPKTVAPNTFVQAPGTAGPNVFVQRPRIIGQADGKNLILNDAFAPRPLLSGGAQTRPPTREMHPEEITITPDVFPQEISLSENCSPGDGEASSSASTAPETINSNASEQEDTRESSSTTETLAVDLNLVKMEFEEDTSCDAS